MTAHQTGSIVACGPAHSPILSLLHQAAFPADPWTTGSFAKLLSQPGVFAFIDERGGFVVLRLVLDEAEIITLGAVQKRRGIGTALLTAAIAEATAKNAVTLFLEVAEHNIPARTLYASFGFTQTGRRRRYYPDGSDALTLALPLPKPNP